MPNFYEFFAGAGMARTGLGSGWQCTFANDFDLKKARVYMQNWGGAELVASDIKSVRAQDLPGRADLVWASFPCQDLSLAGGGAGLRGERSGTFWPFWSLVSDLRKVRRQPSIVVLENVCGTLTSHGGRDFAAICGALADEGYSFGAVVVDAALFLPHSRPRLFVIGIKDGRRIPDWMTADEAQLPWHSTALRRAYAGLPEAAKEKWIWWNMPNPPRLSLRLEQLIEDVPEGVEWHTKAETAKLLSMMSEKNRAKVREVAKSGRREVGAIYKRTRKDEDGNKVQRAEVRFDDLAGCLRTPAGGSSRQLILVVEGNDLRSRLLSSREAARLMGLPDTYVLPAKYNEAYHLMGDGVAVPVVRFLAQNIIEPILSGPQSGKVAA
jgi:DNA (cytosine-5)-methyltransferase 1